MTVIVHGQDARGLRGKAFITLDRISVLIDDDRWDEVIGRMLCLEGGTELDVDDDRLDSLLINYDANEDGPLKADTLVPVVVRDIYMPRVRALIKWGDLVNRVNVIQPGDGVRADGERVPCSTDCGGCISCYYERWTAAARILGIETDQENTE